MRLLTQMAIAAVIGVGLWAAKQAYDWIIQPTTTDAKQQDIQEIMKKVQCWLKDNSESKFVRVTIYLLNATPFLTKSVLTPKGNEFIKGYQRLIFVGEKSVCFDFDVKFILDVVKRFADEGVIEYVSLQNVPQ